MAGAWSGWYVLGEGAFSQTAGLAVTSRYPNNIECFAMGQDNMIRWRSFDGQNWGGWQLIGEGAFSQTARLAATSRYPGNIELFAMGQDNMIRGRAFRPDAITTTGDQLDFDFSPITFDSGVPVGGFAHLTMFKSGNCRFTGHFHDSGGTEYNMATVVAVQDSAGMVYTAQHEGHVSGTFQPGSRDDDWDVSIQDDRVASRWSFLAAGSTAQQRSEANGDLVNLTNALIGAGGFVLGVIALFTGGGSGGDGKQPSPEPPSPEPPSPGPPGGGS